MFRRKKDSGVPEEAASWLSLQPSPVAFFDASGSLVACNPLASAFYTGKLALCFQPLIISDHGVMTQTRMEQPRQSSALSLIALCHPFGTRLARLSSIGE